jgi:hypothetical protein
MRASGTAARGRGGYLEPSLCTWIMDVQNTLFTISSSRVCREGGTNLLNFGSVLKNFGSTCIKN